MSGSKVKRQGHQGQISSPLKMHCDAHAANNVMQQQTGPLRTAGGDGSAKTPPVKCDLRCGLRAVHVW